MDLGRFALQCFVLSLAAVLLTHGEYGRNVITTGCVNPPKSLNQSTPFPTSPHHGTVHMSCEMEFPSPTAASNATASWWRFPHRPSSAPPLNFTFTSEASGNNARVDLILRNVTRQFDEADYTIIVGECKSVCANISLRVRDDCSIKPESTDQLNTTVSVPLGTSSVELTTNFTGDKGMSELNYPIIFSNDTVTDLLLYESRSNNGKYSIKSQEYYEPCKFSVKLVIHNITVADAGVYTAKAIGRGYSSQETFFHLNVIDGTIEWDRLWLISLGLGVIALVLVALCVWVGCVCRRRLTHRRGQRTEPLLLSQPYIHQRAATHHSVVFVYDKRGLSLNTLVDLLQVLALFPGIKTYTDLSVRENHDGYPDNWSRWMQQMLDSCDHILVICSEQLYKDFLHVNNRRDDGMVEMFEGKCYTRAILPCLDLSKVSLLFIDRPKDTRIVPLPELRDRMSFCLNLTHLLATAQDEHMLLEQAIKYNPAFRDFRVFIEHLQY